VFDDSDGPELLRLVVEAPTRRMSSADALEAWIVVDRRSDPAKVQTLDALMQTLDIDIEPFTSPQTGIAGEAYRIYGKGNHPVGQNYRNRFAYALTKAPGQRLLFKRQDFPPTDIDVA